MTEFKEMYLMDRKNERLLILDLGSMDVNGSYRPLFDEPVWKYIGLDMAPGDNVDIVLDNPYSWKEIKSSSVDILISGQAFEHIEYFWITMLEIEHLLKPGGLCCIIAPSSGFEHKYPVDCWRFYPDGFKAVARFAGLKVLEISTQWTPEEKYIKDDSNKWQDTKIVCVKDKIPLVGSLSRKMKLFFIRKTLLLLCK